MNTLAQPSSSRTGFYSGYLLFIAGMGGLLYGIDIGIISAALLYLSKTVSLTVGQTSAIVAAVLGGSMLSSLVGGFLADWFGRRTMMIVSGLMFVVSVGLIVLSHGFVSLFLGRLLQGLSTGIIAVVVPLYLAETLAPAIRGRGTAVFQLMLTVGILLAAGAGWYYTQGAERAIAGANGNMQVIQAAQDHAWRFMFLSLVYPGLIFFFGSFFLSESPRWLFRRGKVEATLAALRRTSSEREAELQLEEMQNVTEAKLADAGSRSAAGAASDSLFRRKYILPFVLACIVLACNQTTGINSILSYLVLILRQAGMTAAHATQGDVVVKLLNCLMTLVAIALVDRKGRKFLLSIGTAGIVVALGTGAVLFHSFEGKRVDLRDAVQTQVQGAQLTLPLASARAMDAAMQGPVSLNVLYNFGGGDSVAAVQTGDAETVLKLAPPAGAASHPLVIRHAFLTPVPSESMGWSIAGCLCLFIMCFGVGPGVVVWLMLTELMPTRIRSAGMGIALLINQGVSTLIAGLFLPVVGDHGYGAMFGFWAACSVVYFITAAFFLPETKGRTLEEIELYFEGASATAPVTR